MTYQRSVAIVAKIVYCVKINIIYLKGTCTGLVMFPIGIICQTFLILGIYISCGKLLSMRAVPGILNDTSLKLQI